MRKRLNEQLVFVCILLCTIAYFGHEWMLLLSSSSSSLSFDRHLARSNESTTTTTTTPVATIYNNKVNSNDSLARIQQRMLDGELPVRAAVNTLWKNGYSNRLYSMLTTLCVSLFTESAFFVANWTEIGAYIEEPFAGTFRFYELPRFVELMTSSAAANRQEISVNNKQRWVVRKQLDYFVTYEINMTRPLYVVPWVDAYFFAMCANPARYARLNELGLVARSTTERALAALNASQLDESAKLERVLRVGFEAGGNMLNKYWLPNHKLRTFIAHYKAKYFDTHYVIGVQFRFEFFGIPAAKLNASDCPLLFFERCAHNIERQWLLDNSSSSSKPKDKVLWFVATDHSYVYSILESRHGANKVLWARGISLDGWESVIVDVELLALCDEIVVTGGSSLGFTAAMKSQRLPYHFDYGVNMTECKRATLSDPPRNIDQPSF